MDKWERGLDLFRACQRRARSNIWRAIARRVQIRRYHSRCGPGAHFVRRNLVLTNAIQRSRGRLSFFYVIIADSFFRRAANAVRAETSRALRCIGREYLRKAREVGWAFDVEHRAARSGRMKP